jgi:hypothetical protein
MYEQVDTEGNTHCMMDEIVDHKKQADAVHFDDNHTVDGKEQKTTHGLKLCVKWKDGTWSWEKMAILKEGFAIEVSEYAISNKLASEPAFAWRVRSTLRKRDQIILYYCPKMYVKHYR